MTSNLELAGTPASRSPRRRRWIGAGVASLAAAGGALASLPLLRPRASGTTGTPPATRATGLPDVPLLTHEGRQVRFLSDLVRGRVVFVNMMYAQCGNLCPPMTQNLRRVQQALGARLGRDVFMYSVSLLPEQDRPADLRDYMQRQGVGPGWTFLTGPRTSVESVRTALGFRDPDPAADADIARHTGMVRIGNEALDRWCMAPALAEPQQLLEALMAVDPRTRASGRIAVV